MYGFGNFASAARFCSAFDELTWKELCFDRVSDESNPETWGCFPGQIYLFKAQADKIWPLLSWLASVLLAMIRETASEILLRGRKGIEFL